MLARAKPVRRSSKIASDTAPAPSEMTYAEFLRWEGSNPHVEWVNGALVTMAGVKRSYGSGRGSADDLAMLGASSPCRITKV